MMDGLTDNRNRTGPEIKKIFEKRGGSLGASGCVSWMFSKKGLITVRTDSIGENELMEIALSAGADDMEKVADIYELTCDPAAYEELKRTLGEREIPTEVAEISMVPQNTVPVNDVGTAQKVLGLMEEFEDHEDVQNVYANFDIPDEIVKQVEE